MEPIDIPVLILTALAAFVINLVLTPIILGFSVKKDWLDRPNARSFHKEPVPRLAGLGIFATFFFCFAGLLIWDQWNHSLLPQAIQTTRTALALFGLISMFIVGLLDDFVQFRAIYKFLLQLLGAVFAIGAGLVITSLSIPFTSISFDLGNFGPLLTLLWVVGVTNAVNLIDGMDGLAGGFSLLAFLFLGIAMALAGHYIACLACFILVGALTAFLVYNWPPAKIFMGDAGSLALGYVMSVIPLWGGPDESLFHKLWLLPFTVVLIPVGDTIAAIIRRSRQGVPIWAADKEHTHHKLLRLGIDTRGVLAIFYVTFIVTASPVLVMVSVPEAVQSGNLLLWLSLGSVSVILILFTVLHTVYRKRFPDPLHPKSQS